MDPMEDLRKLYEKLPPGSAFRSTIERALGIAEKITGLPLTGRKESPPPGSPPGGDPESQAAQTK